MNVLPNRIFKTGLVRQAIDAGKTRYFTGKPCRHGHIAERMVSSGSCCECLRIRRGKYDRSFNPVLRQLYEATSPKRKWAYRGAKRQDKLQFLAGRPKPNICEVCGRDVPNQIVFDHCHKSQEFRGWICTPCNIVLGMVNDSPERLRKLADYLEKK